ncbi:hypothetical protein VNO77_44266 [Canavalia gladiata]|uniref:Uncharacterized protein n=1 Tax=Canavalia gladiata TaxID=3824 RepID=A0AAN9PNM5_CANGL
MEKYEGLHVKFVTVGGDLQGLWHGFFSDVAWPVADPAVEFSWILADDRRCGYPWASFLLTLPWCFASPDCLADAARVGQPRICAELHVAMELWDCSDGSCGRSGRVARWRFSADRRSVVGGSYSRSYIHASDRLSVLPGLTGGALFSVSGTRVFNSELGQWWTWKVRHSGAWPTLVRSLGFESVVFRIL